MSILRDKKVLIVEDDEILREVIVEEFEDNKCNVSSAVSGKQAIKIIMEQEVPFDAIITDVQMPDGNGAFLLDEVRKLNLTKPPIIVMISGYSDLPTEELLRKGAHFVLAKPFELNELIDTVVKFLPNPQAS